MGGNDRPHAAARRIDALGPALSAFGRFDFGLCELVTAGRAPVGLFDRTRLTEHYPLGDANVASRLELSAIKSRLFLTEWAARVVSTPGYTRIGR